MTDIQNTNNEPNDKQEQRLHAILFLVMLAALVLGFWQINNDIRLPFNWLNKSLANTNNSGITSDDQLSLMAKDADKDGLSDYDEIYLYKTSPYLQDTDSDNYPDKQEIESGNDPTCPAHQTCLKSALAFSKGASSPQTVAELREALKQAGLKEEDLKTIDDATLLQVYNEVALETGAVSTTDQTVDNSTTVTNTSNQTSTNQDTSQTAVTLTEEEKQLIKQMSGSELRTFLKQSGITSAELDKVDDASLKLIVNQALGL